MFMELKLGSQGTNVSFFQSVLKTLGIYDKNVDGIFGSSTETAVKKLQAKLNLKQTGIITNEFVIELYPYITVPTDIAYTSNIVYIILEAFKYKYKFLEFENIGKSVLGKDIEEIRIGTGTSHVLYVASTHANEWITTPLVLKFVEEYAESYQNGTNIYGKSSRELFSKCTIHIVPLLNPDGIDLVNNALDSKSEAYTNAVKISSNYPNIAFPNGWKANIQGIDLNLQFPAHWEQAREIKFNQGYTSPAPRDYVGEYPLQAQESLAIYDYTISNNFRLMLTFHTQGEVIYWKFLDYNPPRAQEIATELSNSSGYTLEDTPYTSSFAGFKDWFIEQFNLPGYTIEAGLGINPLPISQFNKIYQDCLGIMVLGAYLI